MGYSQITGMSSTRFPLRGLGGCGCQATSGLGQATASSPIGGLLTLGIFGMLAYLTFTSPGTWRIGKHTSYTSGGHYYDSGLGKWVNANRRRARRRRRAR